LSEEHNNGQRPPPCVPKTGPYFYRIIEAVLGFQKINGINPRSAIKQQQQQHLFILILLQNVSARKFCLNTRGCLGDVLGASAFHNKVGRII
jgi:hypothetical protein